MRTSSKGHFLSICYSFVFILTSVVLLFLCRGLVCFLSSSLLSQLLTSLKLCWFLVLFGFDSRSLSSLLLISTALSLTTGGGPTMTRRLFGLCQDFVHLVTSVSRSCASMRFVHFVYSVGLLYVQCTPCICAFIDCKCKGLLFLMLCRLQMQRPELLDDLLPLQMQELLKDNALCAANRKDKE